MKGFHNIFVESVKNQVVLSLFIARDIGGDDHAVC